MWYNGDMTEALSARQSKLPLFFKPILWSYNFSALDPDIHKKAIIINTINYGNLSHWRWIIQRYGREEIKELLEATTVATELRPRAQRLAGIIFSSNFHDAPRGSYGAGKRGVPTVSRV